MIKEENPYLIVLGIAQDGGVPQAGSKNHPGWKDPSFKRLVVCLAIVDPEFSQRWIFECTPDFREQLHRLDKAFPVKKIPGIDGIFLTHAHMGHYSGLLFLGFESMDAMGVPVYAMPRMREFLSSNAPWHQLVANHNISIKPLKEGEPIRLNIQLTVEPFLSSHRQEFSEVVGFRIDGPNRSILFIPDIDRWENWILDLLSQVDVAYLDGTFYEKREVKGRDMSSFPHPTIQESMERFESLPLKDRNKIRFIHLNHTNPALIRDSDARKTIEKNGFRVAEEMERFEL